MRSPNAQGGPGWKDTHLVAWNVAFGDEGLPEARAPGARSYLKAHGLHPWAQYSQPQVRPGRDAGMTSCQTSVGVCLRPSPAATSSMRSRTS